MCILFLYNGDYDAESDYSLILASNRDEYYDRPTQNMAPWKEDPSVIAGRDLELNCEGGTWLGLSTVHRKIGVLLNLPRAPKPEAKSRGKLVADFLRNTLSTIQYIESMKEYIDKCNGFIFVSIEFGHTPLSVHTYSNATDKLTAHKETYFGNGNSLPENPLKKTEAGKNQLKDICSKWNKVHMKTQLINELIGLLKSEESHLPDLQLESRRPDIYKQLSSIYVNIPEGRYGTRTHTLILVTKSGHIDVIEISLESPIDLENPKWHKAEYQFDL